MEARDRIAHPLEQARAVLPDELLKARVLGFAAHEQEAIALFGFGDHPPKLWVEQTHFHRTAAGEWCSYVDNDQDGWIQTWSTPYGIGALTSWHEVGLQAARVVIRFLDRTHDVPVVDGWFLFAAWDVPLARLSGGLWHGFHNPGGGGRDDPEALQHITERWPETVDPPIVTALLDAEGRSLPLPRRSWTAHAAE